MKLLFGTPTLRASNQLLAPLHRMRDGNDRTGPALRRAHCRRPLPFDNHLRAMTSAPCWTV